MGEIYHFSFWRYFRHTERVYWYYVLERKYREYFELAKTHN